MMLKLFRLKYISCTILGAVLTKELFFRKYVLLIAVHCCPTNPLTQFISL